jgi:hypothetical protein
MFKMPRFIKTHWQDIKGNAKWDFIKWAVIGIFTLLVAITRFSQHAPFWQVLIALIVAFVCVFFVISLIQKFTKESPLEIDAISQLMPSFSRYNCQIRVHNQKTVAVDDVRVELIGMESSTEPVIDAWLLPRLPFALFPMKTHDKNSINPGDNLAFNLFSITKTKFALPSNRQIWDYFVAAEFADSANQVVAAARFDKNKNYRFKFKVTTRDSSPTESEINLKFTGEYDQCFFNSNTIR